MKDGPDSIEAVYRAVRDLTPDVVQAATPIPAVAVVLWRRRDDGEVEVYVVRRAAALKFLGGFWSFPGGRIEPRDGQQEVEGADGNEAAEVAAGVRELEEELGIVLPCAAGAYLRGGRWITPEIVPIRFDARYLIHQYDGPEPDPSVSEGELDRGEWVSAPELRDHWATARWLVPSPIIRVISAVSELVSTPEALDARLALEIEAEQASPRIWYPVLGVGVCPLRTPTLPPATHTNCLVLGTEEVVVIDPASPYPDEQVHLDRVVDALRGEGKRVREVWLTHHHGDHVGGARYLADRLGIGVAAHAITAELLSPRIAVDRHIEDGEVIDLAGHPRRRVRAIHTPGHAAGHLCFLEEETGFLVVGDMVAGVGTILIDPSEGSMSDYLESLRRLKALAPRALLPAHGPTITDPQGKLDEYIAHRNWREERVVAALSDGGLQLGPLVAEVYRDVPAAVHPIATRSLLAHLEKLVADGRVRALGGTWELAASG